MTTITVLDMGGVSVSGCISGNTVTLGYHKKGASSGELLCSGTAVEEVILEASQSEGAQTLTLEVLDDGLIPRVDRITGRPVVGDRFDAGVSWRVGIPSTDDVTVTFDVPAAGGGAREQEWTLVIDEKAPPVTLRVTVKRLAI